MLHEPMCSFLFMVFGPFAPNSTPFCPTAERREPSRRTSKSDSFSNPGLAAVLLDFFQKRLRVDSASAPLPGLASLLVRRTFGRIAKRRAAEDKMHNQAETGVPTLQKAEVLYAALMELRRLEMSDLSIPDTTSPSMRRN